MKKILVVLTGGTIGSKSEKGTVDVSTAAAYSIVSRYYEMYGKDIDFDVIQPINTLSENITYDVWLKLCGCLDNVNCSNYRGIIICHGSDTLTYTSNLIAMLYCRLAVPVVLVASNYELSNEKSNGIANFRNAVCLIGSVKRGVFVSYSNNIGDNDIYLASRIVESDPYLDSYRSFDGRPWGRIIDDKLVVNTEPGLYDINNYKAMSIEAPKSFDNKVMLIRPYPGMDYGNISLEGVSGVVHYMYHSATACTAGESTSLLNFAKRCSEKGIKIYAPSFKDRDIDRAYLSSREILKAGVIPLFNISPESAYVKVLIAENSEGVDINKNIYFESI